MSDTNANESASQNRNRAATRPDPRVEWLANRFGVEAHLVVEDLDELERWRQARARRPIVPWLMSRHGWPEDTAHYYLAALERSAV